MSSNHGRRVVLVIVGFIVGITVLAEITVGILHFVGMLDETSALVGATVGSAFGTLGLVFVIFFQSLLYSDQINQNEDLIKQNRDQTKILQESEWLPHFYPTYEKQFLACSGNKPWFPVFKAKVQDVEPTEWHDVNSYPFQPEETPVPKDVRDMHRFFNFDWFIPFPAKIQNYFREYANHETEAYLYFKFESMAGEWYFFIYQFTLASEGNDYRIIATPEVERLLPWGDLSRWRTLKQDLEESGARSGKFSKLRMEFSEIQDMLESEEDSDH